MNRYLMEFIGTFFLVLIIGCTVIPGTIGPLAPLAIGLGLTALIYAGGVISTAHYNPAVTLAFWLRGAFDPKEILPYIVAQVTAAISGALLAVYLCGPGEPMAMADVPRILVAEILFTFALVFVILSVATSKATAGNSFYGIAIGLVVTAGAFAVGGISGAAFNPAVLIAFALMKLAPIGALWPHLIGALVGAALGVAGFRATHPEDA